MQKYKQKMRHGQTKMAKKIAVMNAHVAIWGMDK
jgi:hypothetical protein